LPCIIALYGCALYSCACFTEIILNRYFPITNVDIIVCWSTGLLFVIIQELFYCICKAVYNRVSRAFLINVYIVNCSWSCRCGHMVMAMKTRTSLALNCPNICQKCLEFVTLISL